MRFGGGPGHVARYLHKQGVQVCGVDLSAELVERAHRLTPGIELRQGDMMALDVPDGTWAGITAFYSIIHIPREDMVRVLSELRRVLRPGGLLLVSFHIGDDTIHLDDWWDQKVCVDFFFFRSAEIAGYLTSAGFEIEEIIEREPYPDVEHIGRGDQLLNSRSIIWSNCKPGQGEELRGRRNGLCPVPILLKQVFDKSALVCRAELPLLAIATLLAIPETR